LRRAYAEAAEAALQRAARVQRILTEAVRVEVPNECIGDVISAAARAGGKIVGTEYGTDALLTIEIRRSKAEEVRRMLTDRTSGKARLCEP
jgi:putative IMPACT (imprinted ancient) family translation regulator